jgi:hypothetical protein
VVGVVVLLQSATALWVQFPPFEWMALGELQPAVRACAPEPCEGFRPVPLELALRVGIDVFGAINDTKEVGWGVAHYTLASGEAFVWVRRTGKASKWCAGRCGEGCDGFGGEFTRHCFNHDACVAHTGGGVGPFEADCGDEFLGAFGDYVTTTIRGLAGARGQGNNLHRWVLRVRRRRHGLPRRRMRQ